MGKRLLFSTLAWAVTLCASISAFGSNTTAFLFDTEHSENQRVITPKNEINALLLSCKINEHTTKKSFATVLQLSTAGSIKHKYDVAIATGHGVLDDNGNLYSNCFVSYPGSKKFPVTAAKPASNYKPGTPSDWAVIMFPTIKQDKLIRYSVSDNLTQKSFEVFAEIRPTVLFSTARGLPANGQHCEIEPRRFAGLKHVSFAGFLSHTCRAIPGQSGAPISIIRNQEPIIIGIHIGSSMVYGYPTLDTPLFYRGYMREIDAELITEFSEIFAIMKTKLLGKSKL